MKERINEEYLCILKKNNKTNRIEIGYVPIVNPFKSIIDKLSELCNNSESSIDEIVTFISETKEFDKLSRIYRYCENLRNSYQGFTANNNIFIQEIKQKHRKILETQVDRNINHKYENDVIGLKSEIKNKYLLWSKAYSIDLSYHDCSVDKSILIYSHRIDGWSNPVFQLTPNFSVEIKTNFGYGKVSYFFTKLKYKNIDITPFSEWINYEHAKFSDIIRYSQTHLLRNECWLEAMEFACEACNLSLIDEEKFVEKYIIEECEKMVSGLENILNQERFTFYDNEKKVYIKDKQGHILVEFRGEKISGALDFISSIFEFNKIASIKSFITRIENINIIIQPILIEESKLLEKKIENLTKEKNRLQKQFDKVIKTFNNYNIKLEKLKTFMIEQGELNQSKIDTVILETEFCDKYPKYCQFYEKYKKVTGKYYHLSAILQVNNKVKENIISYEEKIRCYFENKTFL